MNYTTNYDLRKPEGTDYYNVEDFNRNADIIDSEMSRLVTIASSSNVNIQSHINDMNNPHNVTKNQIGLSEVDNKSSETIRNELTLQNVVTALGYRPVSPTDTIDNGGVEREGMKFQVVHDTSSNWFDENPVLLVGELGYDATNNILKIGDGVTDWNHLSGVNYDLILNLSKQYTDGVIENLIGTAPSTLDTIYELAEAIQESEDVIVALQTAITNKADKTLASSSNDGLMSSTDKIKLDGLPSTYTDTTYTFAETTGGFTVTPSGGSAQTVNILPNNNVTGSGTSGSIARFSGANTVTNGPAFGSSTTTYLRNDGQWAVPTIPSAVVTGVKGDAESNYRYGDVNITPTNIGLGNLTNHRQVKGLASGTTENHIAVFGADGYTLKDGGYSISELRALILGETIVTGTLLQGNTTITLTDSAITTTSYFKIYTSVYGVAPTSVSVSNGSMTLTFVAQSVDVDIEVRVENPN